jgi:hypothetical protein
MARARFTVVALLGAAYVPTVAGSIRSQDAVGMP